MNSDNCFSYFDKSIYRVYCTPTPDYIGCLDNTFTKEINKDDHKTKTVSHSSQSLSPTNQ